jgi:SAM-dependent methyltransferase
MKTGFMDAATSLLGARRQVDFRCICGSTLRPLIQHGITTHREVDGFSTDIHFCKRCDHVQFAPVPSTTWFDDFYKSGRFWEAGSVDPLVYIDQWVSDPAHLKFIDLIRNAAATLGDRPITLHDFGCGHGGLVKALRASGIDATGSDLSTDTIEFGQRLGLPLTIGGIDDLSRMEPRDIITAYHVAEHFPDPNILLRTLERTLKPGGFLILAFPNGAYAPARMDYFDRYSWCFFPGHIHYYTPMSIAAAFRRNGFELVSLESNHDAEVQLDWLMSVMTVPANSTSEDLLAGMDRDLRSRDLRVVGRKPLRRLRLRRWSVGHTVSSMRRCS